MKTLELPTFLQGQWFAMQPPAVMLHIRATDHKVCFCLEPSEFLLPTDDGLFISPESSTLSVCVATT